MEDIAREDGMSNDWDNVVLDIEQLAYNEGKADGVNDAINDANNDANNDSSYKSGKRLGYFKGYAISIEIEYYKVMITNVINSNSTSNISINDRERKRCDKIIDKINSFPITNDIDYDFDAKINEVRSLYRSLGSLVIPFDYTKPNDSSNDNKNKNISMEW